MKQLTHSLLSFFAVFALWSASPDRAAATQLDETWTVTVNGNSVQADPDGTFRIANVLTLDQFGPAGPGSAPDGLGDTFVRVMASRLTPLGLEQGFSEPFQVPIGGTVVFGPGDIPLFAAPPLPVSLALEIDSALLNFVGETAQATTVATQADGGLIDVTLATQWTSYTTSNPAVLLVDGNGLVTATGTGLAFVTAKNDGTAATALVQVVPSDMLTTVVGFVLEPDGTPISGAEVDVPGQFSTGLSAADGSFALTDVNTSGGLLTVSATGSVGGQTVAGKVMGIEPGPGDLTDAGLILLSPNTSGRFLFVDAVAPAGGPPSTYGYEISEGGDLTPVPGSPFASDFVQPTFTGSGSNLAASTNGAYLFRAGGPNGSIWVNAIASDGSLTEVVGSPFAPDDSGDDYYSPMVATPSGLLVSRARESTPTGPVYGVRTVRIESDGSLTDTGHFTEIPTVPNTVMDFAVNQSGTLLAVSWEAGFFDPGGVRSYVIQPDGSLVLADVHPMAFDPSAVAFAHGDTQLVHIEYGATPFALVRSREISSTGILGPFDFSLTTTSLVPGISGAPNQMALGPDGSQVYIPIRLLNCSQPGEVASISTLNHAVTGMLLESIGPIATFGPTAASPVITSDGAFLFLCKESQSTVCDTEVYIERYALTPGAAPTPLGTTPIYSDPLATGGAFGFLVVD